MCVVIGDKTGKLKEEKQQTAVCCVGTVGTVGEQVLRRRYIVFHFPQAPFSLWISFHSLWD